MKAPVLLSPPFFSRFSPIPAAVYSENSYNLAKSIVLRFPWLLSRIRLVSNRFYFRGHKCCAVYDADSFTDLDQMSSGNAEVLNSR